MQIIFTTTDERKIIDRLCDDLAAKQSTLYKQAHLLLRGAMEAQDAELVPKEISAMADCMERGGVIIGGRQAGKTIASQIAAAKPAVKQLTENPNAGIKSAYPRGRW